MISRLKKIFFHKRLIGIAFNNTNIHWVELEEAQKTFHINQYLSDDISPPLLMNARNEWSQIVSFFKSNLKFSKFKKYPIAISIPHDWVKIHEILVPSVASKIIATEIHDFLYYHDQDASQFVIDYHVIQTATKQNKVFFATAPKDQIDAIKNIFANLNLNLSLITTDVVAISKMIGCLNYHFDACIYYDDSDLLFFMVIDHKLIHYQRLDALPHSLFSILKEIKYILENTHTKSLIIFCNQTFKDEISNLFRDHAHIFIDEKNESLMKLLNVTIFPIKYLLASALAICLYDLDN